MFKEPKMLNLANPEAYDTVPALRQELHKANDLLKQCATDLARQTGVGTELVGFVNALLMQHVRGDHCGVRAMLDAQLNSSSRLREMIEEASESRQVELVQQWAHAEGAEEEPKPPYNCEGENPWAKGTVSELQLALDTANRAGVRLVAENAALGNVVDDMAREMSTIVVAHIKGDRDAVSEAVAAFCAKRVVIKGDGKRKVH